MLMLGKVDLWTLNSSSTYTIRKKSFHRFSGIHKQNDEHFHLFKLSLCIFLHSAPNTSEMKTVNDHWWICLCIRRFLKINIAGDPWTHPGALAAWFALLKFRQFVVSTEHIYPSSLHSLGKAAELLTNILCKLKRRSERQNPNTYHQWVTTPETNVTTLTW